LSLGIQPDWPAPPRVRALTTTRDGGVSTGAWASLNLGLHVGDDPASVRANRRRLVAAANLPAEPIWLEQVHGTHVVQLHPGDCDRRSALQADAAWTSDADVVCCVMTADCLPVLLCDAAGSRVAVAHAGWRGLAAGVIAATVEAMGGGELVAWLGPAISQPAYEVGPEVRAACIAQDPAAAEAFKANAAGRWQADLYRLARRALQRAGVVSIHGGDFCTRSDARRFFSHRREAPCGRMASLIWLADTA
jgi:YfiH family protein